MYKQRYSGLLAAILLAVSNLSHAQWLGKAGIGTYYTDDVALFSVTRRLSLKDDPTQPIVDRPEQGGDFVYEPNGELEWRDENALGELNLSLDAGGYVFANQTAFSHGLYELQLAQNLPTKTKINLIYNVVPELFLGKNEYRRLNGQLSEHDEKLTNHYWSTYLDQAVTDDLTIRLLGRYGLRNYQQPFQHRDTRFWTLGTHVEWTITPRLELLMGYHYERGSASQWKAIHFPDDVSYIAHYASAELKLKVLDHLSTLFIFDWEKTDFTSQTIADDHYRNTEAVYQGELELLYEVTEAVELRLGWQHGNRALTTEARTIKNNNIWLGIDYTF